MSAATRTPSAPARPQAPQRPVPTGAQRAQTGEQENSRRLREAYRTYIFARYEWLRLRAIEQGYLTPAGYKPLQLKGTEQLADVGAKTKVLQDWLKRNGGPEEEAPTVPSTTEPTSEANSEPKRWPIPPKAPRVPCRGCGAPMVFAATEGGKVAPLNLDGTSHFATCPKADQFQYNKPPKGHNAMTKAATQSAPDVPEHVRAIHDLATDKGLCHDKGHRTARLAQTNVFLMDNGREPIDCWRDIRLEDADLLKKGLEQGLLRWP